MRTKVVAQALAPGDLVQQFSHIGVEDFGISRKFNDVVLPTMRQAASVGDEVSGGSNV